MQEMLSTLKKKPHVPWFTFWEAKILQLKYPL